MEAMPRIPRIGAAAGVIEGLGTGSRCSVPSFLDFGFWIEEGKRREREGGERECRVSTSRLIILKDTSLRYLFLSCGILQRRNNTIY